MGVTWGIADNMYAPFAAPGDRSVLLSSGTDGQRYKNPRQPVPYKLISGVVLGQFQGHTSNSDQRVSTLFLRRSLDNGRHWSAPIEIWREPTYSQDVIWLNNGVFVQSASGRVHCFFCRTIDGTGSPPAGQADDDILAMHCYSDDEGKTWSTPTDRSAELKPSGAGWWIPGPAPGVRKEFSPHIGRLIIPFNYRDSPGTGSAPRSGCAYSDDDGVTWQVGMLLTDDGSSESAIAECLDGSIYLTARKQSDGNTDKRWYATSTDGAETVATSGAETALTTFPAAGGVARVGNYLVVCYVGDTGNRANLFLARSSAASAGSVSWTPKLLCPLPSGYSSPVAVSSSEVLVLLESSYNATWSESQNFSWYHYILQAKVTTDWFDDTSVQQVTWAFNRHTSGTFASYGYTVGTPLLAQGDFPLAMQGGAAGSFTATGASSDGTGTAAIVAMRNFSSLGAAVRGNIADPYTGSWSLRIKSLTSTQSSPSGKMLMGNRVAGKGWSLTFGASGVLVFTVYDTTAITCTSNAGTDFTDGTPRDVRCQVNRVTNKLEMYVNNVLQTDNPTIGTGAIVGTVSCIIGATSGTPAAWSWGPITMAKGLLTNDTLPTILSHERLVGGVPALPSQPPSTDLRLWLAATNRADGNGADFEGGHDRREFPLQPGISFHCMRDLVQGVLFTPNSASINRGFSYRQSSGGAGVLIRPSSEAAGGGPWRALPGTDYDFIASTCTGTFVICFELITDSGTVTLLDSMGTNANAAGWQLYYDHSTDKIGLKMGTGSAARFAQTPVTASPTFNAGVTYCLAVRFNGAGNIANFRRRIISGGKLQSATTWNTSSASAELNGSYSSSARPFVIGSRSDDQSYADWMFKNVRLFDTALTDDEIDAEFAFNVAPVFPQWTARRRRAA